MEPQKHSYLLPEIEIAQEDIEPLLVLQEFLEREGVPTSISHRKKGPGSTEYRNFKLKISSKDSVRRFINQATPYLLVAEKRARAARVLEIIEMEPSCRRLDRRVPRPTAVQIFGAKDSILFLDEWKEQHSR